MNSFFDGLFTFLALHSLTVLKLTGIVFLGVLVVVRYLKSFSVSVGKKTSIQGTTRMISTLFSWREFFQFIICMVVYAALVWVLLLPS
jgi:hypothetical protein